MNYALFKIKEGKLEQWQAWCQKLNTELKDEAIDTIVEENLITEFFLIFQIGNDWYTLGGGIDAEGGGKPANPDLAINQEHKRHKSECLDRVSKGDATYFLFNPNYKNQ